MSVKNNEIAERIVEIRELSGFTLEQMAKKLHMSAEEYALYEQNKEDIPVSLLYDICGELKISMTELLTGEKAKLHSYCIVRDGHGLDVERISAYKYQSLAYPFADRKVEPLLVTVGEKDDGLLHLNSHNGQEYHYLLEGELLVQIAEHQVTLTKGDSLYFDSSQLHGMKALHGTLCKILVIVI